MGLLLYLIMSLLDNNLIEQFDEGIAERIKRNAVDIFINSYFGMFHKPSQEVQINTRYLFESYSMGEMLNEPEKFSLFAACIIGENLCCKYFLRILKNGELEQGGWKQGGWKCVKIGLHELVK